MIRLSSVLALGFAGIAGGPAAAQGVALFGDARLGLGYNINNDGTVQGDDDLRAVSRVRFGVNMTGETDSGISFGATIRADNAANGQGAPLDGQNAGNVFVSGGWGTLTFGDTNGADEQWVGDVPGNLSLTGLGDLHETFFISNAGGFGSDDDNNFASNPFARPTVRYDFDIAGFGISLSTNRELTDIGVGAGYAGDFGGGGWSIGAGYYDFASFEVEDPQVTQVVDVNGETVVVPGLVDVVGVPDGHQWSASLNGDYQSFGFGLVYTNAETNDDASLETLGVGATFGWDAVTVGAYYVDILDASGGDGLEESDGDNSYGLTAAYDLGGGAQVAGGVVKTFGAETDNDGETIADFGIRMAF